MTTERMERTQRHWRVEVEWLDSTILELGWYAIPDALAKRTVTIRTSVGFVLADDKKGIVLAGSIHGNQAAGIVVIPRRAIVYVKPWAPTMTSCRHIYVKPWADRCFYCGRSRRVIARAVEARAPESIAVHIERRHPWREAATDYSPLARDFGGVPAPVLVRFMDEVDEVERQVVTHERSCPNRENETSQSCDLRTAWDELVSALAATEGSTE